MVYTRFVELGRVALINYGPDEGKICVVIDVQDGKKALVDGPESKTGVARQIIGIKRLSLTDIKLPLAGRNPRQKQLNKLFDEADVLGKVSCFRPLAVLWLLS
jgi:large subunit ribosomal protein L14e